MAARDCIQNAKTEGKLISNLKKLPLPKDTQRLLQVLLSLSPNKRVWLNVLLQHGLEADRCKQFLLNIKDGSSELMQTLRQLPISKDLAESMIAQIDFHERVKGPSLNVLKEYMREVEAMKFLHNVVSLKQLASKLKENSPENSEEIIKKLQNAVSVHQNLKQKDPSSTTKQAEMRRKQLERLSEKARIAQKKYQRVKWAEVMKRYGRDKQTAKDLVDQVPTGENLVVTGTTEQRSIDRTIPATDVSLLAEAPHIPPGCMATGTREYFDLQSVVKGGYGEIFKGKAHVAQTEGKEDNIAFFALKRALPHTTSTADIIKHLNQQLRKLDALKKEAEVYFSAAFNTGTCRHLALLHDVAQVRNSDGIYEPLLVLQWADGPCSSLREWLKKHPSADVNTLDTTIQSRLSFAVQMCAGLRELHNKDTPTSSFVHNDLKPDNILLFGGGNEDKGGPVRLALTDFGLAVRCNSGQKSGGTPAYMAPEQWLRQIVVTPAPDMWAAGLVMAELFGGKNTISALKEYRRLANQYWELLHVKENRANPANANCRTEAVNKLCDAANKIAPMMKKDAEDVDMHRHSASHAATASGNAVVDAAQVTCQVRMALEKILCGCFTDDINTATHVPPSRVTSAQCERQLVIVWDELFASQNWNVYSKILPKPLLSPFAKVFSAHERRGTFDRVVKGRLIRLMLKRCDAFLEKAEKKGADAKSMQYIHERLEPHKFMLSGKLKRALQSASQHFQEAARTAMIPTCVQCGRRQSCVTDSNAENENTSMLHPSIRSDGKCKGCNTIRFCNEHCEAEYKCSDLGKWHYQHGCCEYIFSWRKKGYPIVGLIQATEVVLLRGEAWEAAGSVADKEKNEIVAKFVEAQAAWERVYNDKSAGTWIEKWNRAIAVGVSRNSDAENALYSPMIEACRRGLVLLVKAVLDVSEEVPGRKCDWFNHTDPRTGITPLFAACDMGHAQVVSLLLDKAGDGIDVNQTMSDSGCTPLLSACHKGHEKVVETLLDKAKDRIDVNKATIKCERASIRGGCTPLFLACQNGHADIVDILLNKAGNRIEVNQSQTSTEATPLYAACENGYTSIVASLLDKAKDRINVNKARKDNGTSPLFMACHNGHTDVVTLLLDNASGKLDIKCLLLLCLIRFTIWSGVFMLCREISRGRISRLTFALSGCCWALHRHTGIVWRPAADKIVLLSLSRLFSPRVRSGVHFVFDRTRSRSRRVIKRSFRTVSQFTKSTFQWVLAQIPSE